MLGRGGHQRSGNGPGGPLAVVGLPFGSGFWYSPHPLFLLPVPDLLTEITRAARAYYAQVDDIMLTATDFHDWRASLSAARQAEVTARGLAAARAEPAFLRYCLEWRGYDMWHFMAGRLSVPAFALWEAHRQFDGDLPPHAVAR